MKKWIALCLCGLMAASLAGCGDSSNLGTAQLGEYKGVSVLVQSTEVTDEEVEEEIQKNLDDNPDFVEVDRPAEEGDTVNRVCRRYRRGHRPGFRFRRFY